MKIGLGRREMYTKRWTNLILVSIGEIQTWLSNLTSILQKIMAYRQKNFHNIKYRPKYWQQLSFKTFFFPIWYLHPIWSGNCRFRQTAPVTEYDGYRRQRKRRGEGGYVYSLSSHTYVTVKKADVVKSQPVILGNTGYIQRNTKEERNTLS
jgi:hypothetical protein